MKALSLACCCIGVLGSCALAQDVRYNFAANVDFAKYKTYRWGKIAGAEQVDQITDSQLKGAIDEVLATKGLMKTDSEMADLVIGYQVSIGAEKEYTTYDPGWAYGPGWGWYGYSGGGFTTTTSTTITTGQVDLDVYDFGQKQLVWRGTASKTLDMKAKPEKRQKNIRKGVAKLLKNFPPPVKKKG